MWNDKQDVLRIAREENVQDVPARLSLVPGEGLAVKRRPEDLPTGSFAKSLPSVTA